MKWRYPFVFTILVMLFALIIGRLFYWQVVKAEMLSGLAQSQYGGFLKIIPKRGEIKTSDGFAIAANKVSYQLFVNPAEIKDKNQTVLALSALLDITKASISASLLPDKFWVPIKAGITAQVKEEIEKLQLSGVGFEERYTRFYPEASIAAHLLGFVGKNEAGADKGYAGLEGFYDRLLGGKEGYMIELHDALGRPIIPKRMPVIGASDGGSLSLSLDRPVQFLAEQKLKDAVEKYGAAGGMIGVMDPQTGNIIAMASSPSFSQAKYWEYDESLYTNPFITNTYEPGSTLKPMIMAGALDAGLVMPQTKCNICGGPVSVSGYDLHTWNDKYYKDTNMIEVIQHSDNTGMVFVAQKLGVDRMMSYLTKFGIGESTGIDLQGETAPPLKPRSAWYAVDLATTGFGQGISVTPIELLTAFSVLANGGKLMQPKVVTAFSNANGELIKIPAKVKGTPVSEKTAKIMTEILVNAVEKGEAQWTRLKGYRIAGKTGTASIPVKGHYDPDSTIVSFIGFAPAEKPKFVMLVILEKPTSSIYAAETAAPVFFDVARNLLGYYGISPSE
ncbi:MAG: peptidoglycan glycosyltransferase, cell division protein FtsI (penicillin-binding protein 3) [Candidatus Levybacteria bacterium]|nr:peptidoglycan glycosyltransferase, cell division protein FtsI (penicillin-binding protein 3) [Candidatus Levybacteria bacterium]